MPTPKVGLLTVALPTERVDLAEKWNKLAFEKLSDSGLDVIHFEKIVMTEKDAVYAARELKDKGVDCIIYFIGTWIYAPQVVTAVKEVPIPFIIWSPPDPVTFSLTGAGVTHGSLDEMGIKHKFIYGSPDSAHTIKDIVTYARAAMTVQRLRGSKLGNIGGLTMGMYTSMVDYPQIKDVFGVEIEHVDQYQLVLEAEKVQEEDVDQLREWLKHEFGKIYAPEDVLKKSIRLYLGLKKIIAENDYKLVSIKCQPEVINNYTSCCLAVALMNDDGIVCSCEGDLNAALTMRVLNLLTDQPVLFADVNHVDLEKNVIRGVNCGAAATKLAVSRKDVEWGYQYETMGKNRGVTTIFCCKSGRVTLARLSRIKGQYVMLIASGEAFEQPKEVFKEAADIWPHAFIRLDGDSRKFIANCRSNHLHMAYGNIKNELIDACYIIGIDPIII